MVVTNAYQVARRRRARKQEQTRKSVDERLWDACTAGNVALVRHLVERQGAQVDKPRQVDDESHGMRVLHLACELGHSRLVAYLLPLTNPNLGDHYGRTPLMWAIHMGHPSIVRLLLEDRRVGANLRSEEDGMTPLWLAVDRADVQMVKLLLASRDQIEMVAIRDLGAPWHQTTPLERAQQKGCRSLVRLLREYALSPRKTAMELREELAWPTQPATFLALALFVCDELLVPFHQEKNSIYSAVSCSWLRAH